MSTSNVIVTQRWLHPSFEGGSGEIQNLRGYVFLIRPLVS